MHKPAIANLALVDVCCLNAGGAEETREGVGDVDAVDPPDALQAVEASLTRAVGGGDCVARGKIWVSVLLVTSLGAIEEILRFLDSVMEHVAVRLRLFRAQLGVAVPRWRDLVRAWAGMHRACRDGKQSREEMSFAHLICSR